MTEQERLKAIAEVIRSVDQRAMAVDGPVTPTCEEITDHDLKKIYYLATGKIKSYKRLIRNG